MSQTRFLVQVQLWPSFHEADTALYIWIAAGSQTWEYLGKYESSFKLAPQKEEERLKKEETILKISRWQF